MHKSLFILTGSLPPSSSAPSASSSNSDHRLMCHLVVGTPYLLSTILLGLIYKDRKRGRNNQQVSMKTVLLLLAVRSWNQAITNKTVLLAATYIYFCLVSETLVYFQALYGECWIIKTLGLGKKVRKKQLGVVCITDEFFLHTVWPVIRIKDLLKLMCEPCECKWTCTHVNRNPLRLIGDSCLYIHSYSINRCC